MRNIPGLVLARQLAKTRVRSTNTQWPSVSSHRTFISHPRPAKELPKRELPILESLSGKLFYVGVGVLVISTWGAFILYAMNLERLSSSVVRQIFAVLQDNDRVVASLGDKIIAVPAWYAVGQPWVTGSINMLQGNVDVSFRVQGSQGGGTVYFSSVRKQKGSPFIVLRFKVIADNGEVLILNEGGVHGPL